MKRFDERRDLHGKTVEQLQSDLQTAERELLDYRFDAGLNRLTNPAGMHNVRKRIARIKTIISEKELLAESGFSTIEEYKAYRVTERRSYKTEKSSAR